jgi:exonuclease III
MRVLALNVRSGGNRSIFAPVVARMLRHDPNVVVISEFRNTPAGDALRADLERAGFAHQAATPGRGNGVLIASTEPLSARVNPFGLGDDEYPDAMIEATIGTVHVIGVYLPGQDRKRAHLRYLIAYADYCNAAGIDALAIGDFNSGRDVTDIELNVRHGAIIEAFSTADLYAELEERWVEAWQHLHPDTHEFSWYPFRTDPDYESRSGWRIDKAFTSRPLLPRLRAADYDHFFRLDRLTDHSAIVVTLDDVTAEDDTSRTSTGDLRSPSR